MRIIINFNHLKALYIFLITLSLSIFFFSTVKANAKTFSINNIEISKPFEIKFDKNQIIDQGFDKAFFELMSLILNNLDQRRIVNTKLNEIKGMVETFSIKEEKFINEIYYVNLGVSFNKKKVFNFLEKKNIFPSIPKKKTFLFIPIIIDEKKKDLLLFSNNKIFDLWSDFNEKYHLLDYVLPTEDIEDFNLIKDKFDSIENYDFKEISKKYFLKDIIIALIFKNEKEVRILSKISINETMQLKNQSFNNIDITNDQQVGQIVKQLKIIYEDYWKKLNKINTSIKLPLIIKVKNYDNSKISSFENTLDKKDLVNNFTISKFDKNFIFYRIIFNGTSTEFLKSMSYDDYFFNTDKKIWVLK
tara:strand:- start:6283 stop:7362 length:1080 start_codon:yes stop_codon:yes gene_type:complete